MAELNEVLTAVMSKQCYLRKLTDEEMSTRIQKKADSCAVVLNGETSMTVYRNPTPPLPSESITTPSTMPAVISPTTPIATPAVIDKFVTSSNGFDNTNAAMEPDGRQCRNSLSNILNPSPSPFNANRRNDNAPSGTIEVQDQQHWPGLGAYPGPSLTDILNSSLATDTDHASLETGWSFLGVVAGQSGLQQNDCESYI